MHGERLMQLVSSTMVPAVRSRQSTVTHNWQFTIAGTSGRFLNSLLSIAKMQAEVGFIEVFPPRAAGSRPPVLLQTLEAQLLDASSAAVRLATAAPQGGAQKHVAPLCQREAKQRAANLELDVHRQVFRTFAEGFGAYSGLLQRVQGVFDRAIQAGLRDALANGELRRQLLDARRDMARNAAAARAQVLAEQQPARQAAYDRAAAAAAQLAAAQARKAAAARDLQRARDELERLQGLIKASKATRQRLAEAAAAEAEWQARPGAARMCSLMTAPLTAQEDEELEAELGVPLSSEHTTHPLEVALQLLERHDAQAAAQLLARHTGTGKAAAAVAAAAPRVAAAT